MNVNTLLVKSFKLLMLCTSALLFTSCFEILEEIDMNSNGSGKMILTVNLSQSKNKVSSLMLMDSINGHKVPSKKDIQSTLTNISGKLKKISGISDVKTSTDFTNYIASISFSFSDISLVNRATKEILQTYKIKVEEVPVYSYNTSKKIFVYEYKNKGVYTAYNKLKKEDKEIFKNATYTSIYRFPYIVSKTNNAQAKISKSKKAVMQKNSIMDLINNKATLSNQIQLSQ